MVSGSGPHLPLLRQFLTDKLSVDELDSLCFDYFPPVRREFLPTLPHGERVKTLLDWCVRRNDVERLIDAIHSLFPKRFEMHLAGVLQRSAAAQIVPHEAREHLVRNPRQVFISHAMMADGDWAQRLAEGLRTHGWQVWIAPNSLLPGEKWMPAIDRGMQESGVFLLLLTQAAVDSKWVQDETYSAIELAQTGETTFIPLQDPNEQITNIPLSWRRYQHVAFGRARFEDGLLDLLTRLDPETMAGLARQYAEFQQALSARNWEQVQSIGASVLAVYPDYRDVAARMSSVEDARKLEQIQRDRLALLYAELVAAEQQEEWQRVLDVGQELQGLHKGYRDVERHVEMASERLRAREQQAVLGALYAQLQAAVAAGDWGDVIAIGEQIQRTDAGYQDVMQKIGLARENLAAEVTAEKSGLPSWLWWGGAAMVLALAAWGAGAVLGSRAGIVVIETPATVKATLIPDVAAVVAASATRFPAPTATDSVVETPRPTLAAPETSTARPIDTLTAVPSSTVRPTPTSTATQDPGVPPQNPLPGSAWLRPADGMAMVYVPGGTYAMGSEGGPEDEQPAHDVTLDGFWIDRTEVTNAQYAQCVAAGVCEQSAYATDPDLGGADYPVVGVSWMDAETYCEWADGRLLTEAEWEYAARGPSASIYPWGDTGPTCEFAQFHGCDGRTIPAGNLPAGASWVGALDMAGNVWEWVNDWYASDYYQGAQKWNPMGPDTGSRKVLRGGSWDYSGGQVVRSALRNFHRPTYFSINVGIRCSHD